ncbi:MAG: M15 family metallopeptidase [Candidatus Paceibacterota bacterium]|jgi:LAS superfamily LD-carboxypeptidase LdcB
MEKTPRRILPTVIFILFLIPIIASSLLDLERKREDRLLQQEILAEQKAQKETLEKIYLMGKFEPAQRRDFRVVPTKYNVGGYQMYLKKETLNAFLNMVKAADADGVKLSIASATRNFNYQKNLWNNKWTGFILVNGKNLLETVPNEQERFKEILKYSAVPGTSRHHWGTDIDINNANSVYFETEKGEGVYAWLTKNAPLFGFCQPYTLSGTTRPTGYYEEKWHWSYLPLAKTFTEEYKNLITEKDISGFDGDKYVPELNLINDYVLGINPDCL